MAWRFKIPSPRIPQNYSGVNERSWTVGCEPAPVGLADELVSAQIYREIMPRLENAVLKLLASNTELTASSDALSDERANFIQDVAKSIALVYAGRCVGDLRFEDTGKSDNGQVDASRPLLTMLLEHLSGKVGEYQAAEYFREVQRQAECAVSERFGPTP